MADFSFDLPSDLMEGLLQTDFEEIAQECLKEAAPVLETTMKSKVKASISHSGDSEMVSSIKARKPRKGKNGDFSVFVGPSGYSDHTYNKGKNKQRKYKVSNALKGIWLEYGIQHPTHHQPAKPFITASVHACKDAVMRKMQEAYNRKVDT